MGFLNNKKPSDVDERILNSLSQSQRTDSRALKEIAKRQGPLLALMQESDVIRFAYLSQGSGTSLVAVTNNLIVDVAWDSNFSKGGVKSFLLSEIGDIETGTTSDAAFLVNITSSDALPFKAFMRDDRSTAYEKYWAGTIVLKFKERTRLDEFLLVVRQ